MDKVVLKLSIISFIHILSLGALADTAEDNNDAVLLFSSAVTMDARVRIDNVIGFLQKIELSQSTPLYQKFFGSSLTGEVYAQKGVNLIGSEGPMIRTHYAETRSRTVIAFIHKENRTFILTNNLVEEPLEDEFNKVALASVFVHEFWHIHELNENFFESHSFCPAQDHYGQPIVGIMSGINFYNKRACEERIDGAYVVQTVFLYNVAQFCKNCTPLEKEAAQRLSDSFSRRISDKSVFNQVIGDENHRK